jgi:cytidylate kinase/pantoate ligase/cytidylate kinase
MIVTIDGPAGAGKSSIARELARSLGFSFLDTGAMYRAITLGAIRKQIDFSDQASLILHAQASRIRWQNDQIFLDDDDVTREIRTPVVTDSIKYVANINQIRNALSQQQREIAARQDIVTEGRDQGTEVFPDAQCKLFLTASPAERAQRRHQQLAELGRPIPLEEIRATQDRRDAEDRERPQGALRPADDAVIVNSDGLNREQVVEMMLVTVRNKLDSQAKSASNNRSNA